MKGRNCENSWAYLSSPLLLNSFLEYLFTVPSLYQPINRLKVKIEGNKKTDEQLEDMQNESSVPNNSQELPSFTSSSARLPVTVDHIKRYKKKGIAIRICFITFTLHTEISNSKALAPVNTRLSTTSRYSWWMFSLKVCKHFNQLNLRASKS